MGGRAFASGEQVSDSFVIEGRLGAGGMGEVYAARDLRTGARVAIKTLPAELFDAKALVRFRREAELAARVDRSGGVVRVHAVGSHRGLPYSVQELLEGGDLADRVRRGPLDPAEACALLVPVARTLARCHARGVLHRDLKPENILFDDEGRPRVADFGLAKDLRNPEAVTRSGEILGTPAYLPPEQLLSATPADPRGDVYGLGAVLYQLLTGRPPYVANTALAVLSQVQAGPPPPPRSLRPGLSPDVEAVCLRAMARDPAARYATMEEFARDLERAAQGVPVSARRLSPPGRAWRLLRARRLLLPTAALLGLVGLAAGALAWRGLAPPATASVAAEALARAEDLEGRLLAACRRGDPSLLPRREELRAGTEALSRLAREGPVGSRREAHERRRRLLALERVLGGGGRGDGEAAGAPLRAAAGSLERALRGDARAGLGALRPHLRKPEPLVSAAWGVCWSRALEDPEAGPSEAERCLEEARWLAGRSPEAGKALRAAAARVLRRCCSAALQEEGPRALNGLPEQAARLRGDLRAFFGSEAPEAWAGVRREVLRSGRAEWVAALEATAPPAGGAVDSERLEAVASSLGTLLRSAPRIPLPESVAGALEERFRAGLRRLEATPAGGEEWLACGDWLCEFESACRYGFGWRAPALPAYTAFLRRRMALGSGPRPRTELVAAVGRHGVYFREGKLYREGLVESRLATARPPVYLPSDSRALRWMEFERTLHVLGKRAMRPLGRERLRPLAERILAERDGDLAPCYVSRVRHMYCYVLRKSLEAAGAAASRSKDLTLLAREARRLLREGAVRQHFEEGVHSLLYVEGVDPEAARAEAAVDEALVSLRAEYGDREGRSVPLIEEPEGLRMCWLLAEAGRQFARDRARRERGEALLREALALEGPWGATEDTHFRALAALLRLLREERRLEEAEGLARPWLERGLTVRAVSGSLFAREAVRLALEGGDPAEARRRLDQALLAHAGEELLRSTREAVERAEQRAR
ncbi:MAG: serine/threonine protein kinase [Planctomycetota bacterium]|nr:MAG: serine/threonine protein kinase [Planctomycetota bacterium]